MFEVWRNAPFAVFRLFKYVAAPPAVALFVPFVPLLLAVPRRRFRAAAIAVSILLVAFSAGPTFAAIFVAGAFLFWAALGPLRRVPALVALALFEAVSAGVFHLPWRLLPAYRDPRLPVVYPGLLTDRELFFYLGLAYTGLRMLHLATRTGEERPSFGRVLLYLSWFPTFRIGPFVAFGEFDREADGGGAPRRGEIAGGLVEAVFGGLLFELVVAGIDRAFFRRLGRDDGSYWYYGFFEHPPQSRLLTLVGVVLVALRYYLLIKAYCHVARGGSRMAGIPLPRSMRWPLLATDVAAFWRRYNVTISRFTEDHVLRPVASRTRPAVAVAAAFLFMGLWHRPAWHTAAWAATQVAAIGIWWRWRTLRRRIGPLRRAAEAVPAAASRTAAVLATLAFVAATVPILLDRNYGGWRVYRRLAGRGDGAASRMIGETRRRAFDPRENLHQYR